MAPGPSQPGSQTLVVNLPSLPLARQLAEVTNFLLAQKAPQITFQAWIEIQAAINQLPTLEDINKKLDKALAKPPATNYQPVTATAKSYAQAAAPKQALPLPTKLTSTKPTFNLTIRQASPGLQQPAAIAKAILHANKSLSVQTAFKHASGAITVSFPTAASCQAATASANMWLPALGPHAVLHQPSYPVEIHGLPVALLPPENPKKPSVDPALVQAVTQVKVQSASWLPKAIQAGRPRSTLRLTLTDPTIANKLIQNGLVLNYQHYPASKAPPRRLPIPCSQCSSLSHHHTACTKATCCSFCSKPHKRQDCPTAPTGTTTPADLDKANCANCHGKHPAWHPSCPALKAAAAATMQAWEATGPLFQVPQITEPTTTSPHTFTWATPSAPSLAITTLASQRRQPNRIQKRGARTSAIQRGLQSSLHSSDQQAAVDQQLSQDMEITPASSETSL